MGSHCHKKVLLYRKPVLQNTLGSLAPLCVTCDIGI